jgi:hypothetical protein
MDDIDRLIAAKATACERYKETGAGADLAAAGEAKQREINARLIGIAGLKEAVDERGQNLDAALEQIYGLCISADDCDELFPIAAAELGPATTGRALFALILAVCGLMYKMDGYQRVAPPGPDLAVIDGGKP